MLYNKDAFENTADFIGFVLTMTLIFSVVGGCFVYSIWRDENQIKKCGSYSACAANTVQRGN